MEPELIKNSNPGRIKRFIKESSKNGLLIILAIILFAISYVAVATFTQNDNQGFFLIDFNNNQDGIVSASETDLRQNIDVDIVAGVAKLSSGATSGFFTTAEIRPASFTQWDYIRVIAPVFSSIQNITGSLYTCDATPVAIPGYQNMQFAGTNLIVSISSLSTTTYPCIRVRVDMINQTGNDGLSPILDSIRVSWDPKPLFLVSVSTPPSIQAGGVYSATVSYSNSYVDATGVVVWMELPTYLNGSITNYTSAYNQNPQTSFSSATAGGLYTAGGLTINGVNIPPNSVYWNLGTVSAGRAGTLVARINTSSGWENGMTLNHLGHIQSTTGQEVVSDSSASIPGSQETELIIASSPSPVLQKTVTGVANVNGVNYVVDALPLTPIVTYTLMLQNQSAPTGRETIFNPVITDDISDILTKLTSICGIASPEDTRLTINNNGSFNGVTNEITWSTTVGSFGSIPPGGSASVSYTVDYTGCTTGVFNNTAEATADNFSSVSDSESVTVGVDVNPVGNFAKGDKIGSSQSIIAGVDDNKYTQQTYGDVFSYLLYGQNTGAVALGGIVMADQIPSSHNFISASLPSNITGGQIYYNINGAGNSPTVPPAYSVTGSGITGAGWTTVPPAVASDVKWVAFYVPCLNSNYFPSSPSNTTCINQPTNVTATITVQIRPSANVCSVAEIENTGFFEINSASPNVSNSSMIDLGPSLVSTDVEQTHAGPSLGVFSSLSTASGPDFLQVGNNGTYTFTINNTGNDTAQNTQLTIDIPKTSINGVTRYLNFVSATGGNVTTIVDPLFSQIGTVVIDLGTISSGNFKTATLTLNLQTGALNNSTFDVVGSVKAEDDNDCRDLTAVVSKETSIESSPSLQSFKAADERVIPGGDIIHYTINYRNTGTSPSTNTYVVDRVPQRTVFETAYTSGTDSSGTTFNCTGCSVYFSNNVVNLPGSLTTADPITVSMINSYFTIGQQISPGVWIPQGYTPEEALWVAWKVDDPSFTPPIFPSGGPTKRVGFTVRNDDNGFPAPLIPSPIGTLISNSPAILADGLPQAVDNQVFTTILPDPGLYLDKVSDKEYVRAGETFNWNIEYYNDSGNADTLVNFIDTLPPGVIVSNVFHQWNSVAVTNGAASGEVSIFSDPSLNISGNLLTFSPTSYKAGDLLKLEGGTLRLAMTVENTVASGEVLVNSIQGHFENPSGAYDVFDTDEVYVENPDLWMSSKQPDIFDPFAGDTLNYTIIFSNEGPHDATNVVITDTLDEGLCYAGPTNVITPGWTLGEPTITGDCNTGPSTLTWNNVISTSGYPVGVIPGLSGNIIVRYNISVVSSIAPGTDLQNGACLQTDIIEDLVYDNCTGITVATPLPDPYVEKQVQSTVNPGANADYSIVYANDTKQPLTNSYIIDSLPDYNSDGKSDMKIISVNGTNGEQFYYHDGPLTGVTPTFDLSNPISLGWQTSFSSDTNFIAIVTGPIVGNSPEFTISITLEATDPQTDLELPTGVSLTNTVEIFLPTGVTDQDYTNNTDAATVITPGIDLWIEKTGNAEGGFPGVGPGDSMTYTVSFGNQGTVPACDVFITDVLSNTLDEATVIHNATTLSLSNIAGATIYPVDTSGNQIFSPVSINFSENSDGDYSFDLGGSDVCLPPGSVGEFEVYAIVDSTLSDGATVSNTAVIGENSPDIEDILTNNTDSSQTVVYRADLSIQKSGVSKGPDNILGTGDDSTTQTSVGENVYYTLEYNNIGSAPAQNSIITETIPTGMCYIDGSITGYPGDATIEFSNDNASTYTYSPTGPVDCSVTNFRIVFGSPIFPGNSVGEDATIGGLGTKTNLAQSGTAGDLILRLSNTVNPISFPAFRNYVYDYNEGNNVIDLNNDGLFDVVLEGREDGRIYRNTSVPGNVSFDMTNPNIQLRLGPIIFEDLDNDGFDDIIHSNPNYTNTEKPYIGRNISTPSTIDFNNYTTITSLPPSTSIQSVTDFNNDGLKDLLFKPNIGGGLPIIIKNTSSLGSVSVNIAVPTNLTGSLCSAPFQMVTKVEDFDNDGKIDILLNCQDRFSYFRNITDVSSSANPIVFDTEQVIDTFIVTINKETEFVDFNNDGLNDIFQTGSSHSLDIFENTSSGSISFANPVSFYDDVNDFLPYGTYKIHDINEDGFLDVVYFGIKNGNTSLVFMENTTSSNGSSITFAAPEVIENISNGQVFDIQFADIDLDGREDLVSQLQNFLSNNRAISVHRNTTSSGNISFASSVLSPTSENSNSSITIVDVDENGKLDFVISGATDGTNNGTNSMVFENISIPGLIRFGDVISLGLSRAYTSPVFKDLDNDGKKDLFIRSGFYEWFPETSSAFRNNSVPGIISFGDNINNGSYVIPVSMSGGGSWQRLQVSHEVPVGTDLEYTIYDDTCGGTPLVPTTSLPNQFIDISSLGSVSDVCLSIDFSTVSSSLSPILDGWQMTYLGGAGEQISYELQVENSSVVPVSFVNTVTIQTDSDEITTDNNTDDYTFGVSQSDVEITKSVNLASADAGDTLIYTLNYTNNGPLDAHNVLIEDNLPAGVTPNGTWTQISGLDPVECVIDYGLNKVSCYGVDSDSNPLSDWVLSPSESGSIQFEGVIAGGGTPISITHTNQSDFETGNTSSNVSTSTIPGSIIPVNSVVPIDVSASAIGSMDFYVYDEFFSLIEGTSGTPADLVNFTLTSLSPVTFQYTGPTPVNVGYMYISLSLTGGTSSSYFLQLSDGDSNGIVDQYYVSTDVGVFNGSASFDITAPLVLNNVAPGYSSAPNPGTVESAPPASYKNTFNMPSTACPTGNRLWGHLTIGKVDPQNIVGVYMSGDDFVSSIIPFNPSMTVEDSFALYGESSPATLYYMVNITRTDPMYMPEIQDISVETVCSGSIAPGSVLINNALISTSTRDTELDNNSDTAITVIGEISNLVVRKNGPTQASIGSNFSYTIEIENNGNAPAENVTLVDVLPTQVNYVSSSATGGVTFSCSNASGTLNCSASGDILAGQIITLTVTVSLPNNVLLIGDTLHNEVTVATTTQEVTMVDNFDEYDITVAPFGNSSISGFVYVDANSNNQKDSSEVGIENVSVFIAGRDLFGNIYGPSKTDHPSVYEEAMNRLVAMNILPNLPYLATDAYPPNYLQINPYSTNATGSWIFDDYNPGTYLILELQPTVYVSTGSNAGYSNTDVSGNPIFDVSRDGIGSFESGLSTDVDVIHTIIVGDNQNAVQYNFGEINGTIGDLVFLDQNLDGTFNGSDTGIAGVQVNLFTDLNNNGSVDAGETMQSTTTDSNGNYLFTGLSVGTQYIVEVVDSTGVLGSYNSIVGPNPGFNNNSQNSSGYVVNLSSGNSVNLTADFGYHQPDTGCVGSGCGGGGCTGPNCNPSGSSGFIGNQVFFDENGNGIFDNGEIGIPGVEITLLIDVDRNGRIGPYDQERTMKTNQYGVYGWGGLSFDYQYMVVVTDSDNVLNEFTHVLGSNGILDNYSKNELGYLINLTALEPINNTADFGYVGYELPQTGQAVSGKMLFSFVLVLSTLLTLWFFRKDRSLTSSITSFNIKYNGKS